MKFNFEKFEAVGGSFAPKITIRTNGALGFSRGALNRFRLTEGDWYVELYYDKSQGVVGIKPTRDGQAKGAIPLVKRTVTASDGAVTLNSFVSAKAFMDFYGIPYQEPQSLRGEWDEESGMIIARVKDLPADVASSREVENGV